MHRARLTVIAIFVLSLTSEAMVNLQKLALSGVATVKIDSVHKRLPNRPSIGNTAKSTESDQEKGSRVLGKESFSTRPGLTSSML